MSLPYFIKKLDVSYLHVFSYSERENTKAIELNGVVPKTTRNKPVENVDNEAIPEKPKRTTKKPVANVDKTTKNNVLIV